jgi:hypothetical protein
MDSVADILPMGIAKRLLAYSLFGVVVMNLLMPCRMTLTTTLGGLVLALVGGIGVIASFSREG